MSLVNMTDQALAMLAGRDSMKAASLAVHGASATAVSGIAA
jgi:hypothetical protein